MMARVGQRGKAAPNDTETILLGSNISSEHWRQLATTYRPLLAHRVELSGDVWHQEKGIPNRWSSFVCSLTPLAGRGVTLAVKEANRQVRDELLSLSSPIRFHFKRCCGYFPSYEACLAGVEKQRVHVSLIFA